MQLYKTPEDVHNASAKHLTRVADGSRLNVRPDPRVGSGRVCLGGTSRV